MEEKDWPVIGLHSDTRATKSCPKDCVSEGVQIRA